MPNETININVPVLARVEGEGALDLAIENGEITDLKLRIFEPPRYFEKFLEGRNYYDVPDVVARICGICPVAYQMSASHAIESVFDVEITPWIHNMRRLFYCGEWLQSHALHVHLLAAPDYLGFNNAIEMAEKFPAEVNRGLMLQSIGNELVALFGGRSVHPVGSRIGGFSKAPAEEKVSELLERVKNAIPDAIELVRWLDTLSLPDDDQDFISVALHHDNEYAFNEGRIISDHGLDIAISEFENHFEEQHIPHSTALHCLLDGQPYLVGPLARVNLNKDQLPEQVKSLMSELTIQFPSKNMFHSIMARALEILFSLIEAQQQLENYQYTDQPHLPLDIKSGTGFGCTEAPRGILWHRYDLDDAGCISKSIIVPPTSQNQTRIEEDLKNSLIKFGLDNEKPDLQLHAEKIIRNYDPCISCATHFLTLNINGDDKVVEELEPVQFADVELDKTLVLGVGSPNQDDDLGWKAIDIIENDDTIKKLTDKGLTLLKLDRPGISIDEQIKTYRHVIIIDAVKTSDKMHTMSWVGAETLKIEPGILSSHGIDLPASIDMINSRQSHDGEMAILGLSEINKSELVRKLVDCLNY